MAKLSYKRRKKLPSSDFALPGRKYPIEDKEHARNALARVSAYGTPAEKAEVRKKVHAKFPTIGEKGHAKKKHHKKTNRKRITAK